MSNKYYFLTAQKRIADTPGIITIGRAPELEKWYVEIGKRAYCINNMSFQSPAPRDAKGLCQLAYSLLQQYASVSIKHLSKEEAQKIWDAQNKKLCRANRASRRLNDIILGAGKK